MPKYLVEMFVSYPLVLEAPDMEKVLDLAEQVNWDDWPDEDAEIIEYSARLVDEEQKQTDDAPPKAAARPAAKLTVIKGGQ